MPANHISNLLHVSLLHLRVIRGIREKLSTIVGDDDFSLEFWLILATLDGAENGLSMTQLSDSMGMRISGVSKNVDKLVKQALVYRQQDSFDHRRVLVFISEFGKEKLARYERQLEELGLLIQNQTDEQGLQQLVRTLNDRDSYSDASMLSYE